MTVFNLGSINLDWFYKIGHMPVAGETLAADTLSFGLGGKGANQSVAIARAGARVVHIGAVGEDRGASVIATLREFGVDTSAIISEAGVNTGHALIFLEPDGENRIVIFPGANQLIAEARVAQVLDGAVPGDTLVMQNETDGQLAAARLARKRV